MASVDTSSGDENPPRRWWIVAAVAGGILLLVGGLAVLSLTTRVFEPDPAAVLLDEVRQSDEPVWLIAWLRDLLDLVRPDTRGEYEITEDLVDLGPEAVPVLIAALADRSEKVRHVAADALGQIGDPRAVPPLAAALKDEAEEVRSEAADALGRLDDRTAVPALIEALGDGEPSVRRAAAGALGNLSRPARQGDAGASPARQGDAAANADAVPALIKALEDTDNEVREAAIRALGDSGDPRVVSVLVAAIRPPGRHGYDPATNALHTLDIPDKAALLRPSLAHADAVVRAAVVGVVIGKAGRDALPDALAALKDPAPEVRAAAAGGLGSIDDSARRGGAEASPAVRPALLAVVNDGDARVRAAAVGSLGNVGGAGAAEAIRPALRDADPAVRKAAATACGDLGEADAAAHLVPLLKDADEDVRRAVARSLGDLGGADALAGLTAALADASPKVRDAAADALGYLGEAAVPALLKALGDSENSVQRFAVNALGRIGDRRAVPGLVAMFQSDPNWLRSDVAEALGDIGGPEAVAALAAVMQGKSGETRIAAAAALVAAGDGRALPVLLEEIGKRRSSQAETVAGALATLGDPRAAPALTAALKSRDSSVRFWAAVALGSIGPPAHQGGDVASPAAAALRPLLNEKNSNVPPVAALALGLLRQADAVTPLAKQALDDSDWEAFAAVVGLARIGTPEAISALRTAAAKSPLPRVRAFAQRAADAGLVAALATEMQTPGKKGEDFPYYAVRLLLYLNDPAAAPALKEARQSKDAKVRLWAGRALARLERSERRP